MDIPQQPNRPRQHFEREFHPLRGSYGSKYDDNAQVQLNILCVKCKELENRLQDILDDGKNGRSVGPIKKVIEHHETASLLRESYRRGCHLCSLIWGSFNTEVHHWEFDTLDNAKAWADVKTWPVTISLFGAQNGSSAVSTELCPPVQHACGPISSEYYLGSSGLFTIGEPLVHPSFRPITSVLPVSTKGTVCRAFYKKCMEICDKTHTRCHRKRVGLLPTRLLRITELPSDTGIGVTYRVQLTSTRDEGLELPEDTRYAALSYCWGQQVAEAAEPCLKLTDFNYQSLMSTDMPFNKLSATIQDAISVTVGLGLQYLWVDALCIKQGSLKDWEHEAAMMCDIYRYCSVVIAASGASDSREGLFAARDPLQLAPCLISGTIIIEAFRRSTYLPEPWHLETRGWVVQEQLLPARSIKFGSYLSWECMELSINEFGLTEHLWYNHISPEKVSSILLERKSTDRVDVEEVRRLWGDILRRYTFTELSNESDKLAAIEGLSSAIQRRTGWKLVFGLWEPFILEELLWKRGFDNYCSGSTGLRPTWTWASLRGPMDPLVHSKPVLWTGVAEYLGVYTPASERLQSSSPVVMKLSGTLWKVLAREPSPGGVPDRQVRVEGWPGQAEVRTSYDHEDRPWTDGEMLLPIGLSVDRYLPRGDFLEGLVVVPNVEATAFERIGYFCFGNHAGGVDLVMAVLNESGGRQTILLE